MSANLDYREDGVAAVVSVGETPWHREGTILMDRTSDEARRVMTDLDHALEVAGLGFEVRKAPAYYLRDGDVETLPDGRIALRPEQLVEGRTGGIIIRTDRMEELATVGPEFTPLQNSQAFEPARAVLEQGLATVETAGALEGGADVWLLARLVPSRLVEAAERAVLRGLPKGSSVVRPESAVADLDGYLGEVLPFLHFSNHHGGRRAATVQETGVRVVCAQHAGGRAGP